MNTCRRMVYTIAAVSLFASGAEASSIEVESHNVTNVPVTNFITLPDSTTGVFSPELVGSIRSVQRSPYQNTSIPDTPYSALSVGSAGPGSATYNCPIGCVALDLMWGSPDSYNSLTFYTGVNATGDVLAQLIGTDLVPPATEGLGFDDVHFVAPVLPFGSVVLANSGTAAFEWSNLLTTPVPGPVVGAGLPGLIAALGGLVVMARRRRKQLALSRPLLRATRWRVLPARRSLPTCPVVLARFGW